MSKYMYAVMVLFMCAIRAGTWPVDNEAKLGKADHVHVMASKPDQWHAASLLPTQNSRDESNGGA